MKQFAFNHSETIKNACDSILIRYRKQDTLIDILKIGLLLFVMFFSMFVYLRYVNLSSTRGYFLRKENQNLSNISFQYEILKTQLLEQKQKNRAQVDGGFTKREVVNVTAEIVHIPSITELSINK